jgi:hypothetical protein
MWDLTLIACMCAALQTLQTRRRTIFLVVFACSVRRMLEQVGGARAAHGIDSAPNRECSHQRTFFLNTGFVCPPNPDCLRS